MKLCKLNKEEHYKTRSLYETVFTEDSPEFVEYYYSVKAKDNEIYVIEEGDEIVSMVHLNPYQMRIGTELYPTHYIVAVATKEAYRKRGYMRALLEYAMDIMTDRGEPFTFLMPAAEAIYKPFGFRYVYEQRQCEKSGCMDEDAKSKFCCAEEADCAEIATFANRMLQEYEIVTWRDDMYYRNLLAELKSEAGGILLVRQNGELLGVFCYAETGEKNGPRYLIREPIFKKEEVLRQAIYALTGSESETVSVVGIGNEKKPMIMAKALQSEFIGMLENARIFLNEVV